MGSLSRKIKRQQPQPALRAPLAKPMEEPPEKVKIFGDLVHRHGFQQGFDQGYRACIGEVFANLAYILMYHEEILRHKSNRLQVLFQVMRMLNEDYSLKRTPKMMAAIEELRRQGLDIDVIEDVDCGND